MCDPVTGLMVASTLLSAAGSIQQGNATAAAGRYNNQIAQMNASISEKRAKDALERGKIEEQKKRKQVAQISGAQQAAMAANGVDISFGSPLDTLVDTAVQGELDALTIRSNTYREEYDYRVQAANQRAGGQLELMKGKSAQTAGYIGAGSTILGGGAQIAKYNKTGSIS